MAEQFGLRGGDESLQEVLSGDSDDADSSYGFKTANVNEDDEEDQSRFNELAVTDRMLTGDVLVYLLDVHSLQEGGDSELEEMTTIAAEMRSRDCQQLVVATKSDRLIDDFVGDSTRVGDPNDAELMFEGDIDQDEDLESFSEFVNEHPLFEAADELLSATDTEYIHPVYFDTVDGEGERDPRPDEAGQLSPNGMEELYVELKKRL
jgi:hypothetical protein